MTETRIILLRHARTEWNDDARFQGHRDSPLTLAGVAQARALAQRVRGERIAALYSSDLGRAQQTAQHLSEATGQPIRLEAGLRERCLGIFEGRGELEIKALFPEESARYYSRDPDYIVPQGESVRQRLEIGLACLHTLALRHIGETVAAVTHGGVVSGMFRHVVGIPLAAPRRFPADNAAFNSLIFQPGGGWFLETWGDIRHFAQIPCVPELEPLEDPFDPSL